MMMVWPHSVELEVRGSRSDHGMIKAATCEAKTGADILHFQIRQFFTYLLWSEAVGEQIQYVLDADAQTTNTRTPTTLLWINCNAFS